MAAAWARYAQYIGGILTDRDLPVLRIDNVSDYYFRGTEQEYFSLDRDFPNLAPPFPRFWCEYRLPSEIHSKDKGITEVCPSLMGKDAAAGVLTVALDPADVQTAEGDLPAGTKWILWMDLYVYYGRGLQLRPDGPHGAMFLAVDAQGSALAAPWMQSYAGPEYSSLMRSLMTWLHPTLLAVSFLHCRNVRVEDNPVPKPLAKKYHAKNGQWPSAYKTLVIEPLKEILRREGGSDRHGLAKAMHICRGHFADYSMGKGLFGKYHGRFWIPATVRGTKGKSAPAREIEVKV
jgi:hypothetical protein